MCPALIFYFAVELSTEKVTACPRQAVAINDPPWSNWQGGLSRTVRDR